MKPYVLALAAAAILTSPAVAQKLGKGGTGVDENSELPQCDLPLGTVALVEDRSVAGVEDELPPGMRALVQLAERQNGGSIARVDPLPLLKLLAARSGCFQVAERGETFDALQKERLLAAAGSVENGSALTGATLKAADYLLTAQVLYTDNNSKGGAAGSGGMFGSALGLKTKTLESQTMLTLVDVKTGIQRAVATGSARKKDYTVVGGGLLLSLGVGALGGAYTNTDPGKVLSLAMLDAFRKLTLDAQRRIAPVAMTPPPVAARPVPAKGN
jgi:hypothetical protein